MSQKSAESLFRYALLALLYIASISGTAQAADLDWKRLTVPGARCGNGQPYKIYFNDQGQLEDSAQASGQSSSGIKNRSKDVLIMLEAGGACWNKKSCFGIRPLANLEPSRKVFWEGGIFDGRLRKNPFAKYTKVFLPYCTADVHLGQHAADYEGRAVKHEGRYNVEKTIRFLENEGLLDLSTNQRFVLYGFSAGALGALYHIKYFDQMLGLNSRRFLIADAPGLHFGSRFWDKFSGDLIRDYRSALGEVGFNMQRGQGNIAGVVPSVCNLFPNWRIGVLQGTKDIAMSTIYGNISPSDHEDLIFGPGGLFAITSDPADNCAVWTPRTLMHTFLVTGWSAHRIRTEEKSAMSFVWDLVSNNTRSLRNYGRPDQLEVEVPAPEEGAEPRP